MNSENSTLDQLASTLAEAAEEAHNLSDKVNEVARANQTTRVSIAVNVLLSLIILAVAGFAVSAVSGVHDLTHEIRSCSVPEGACAQRQAAAYELAVRAITVRSEIARNQTELGLAQQRGDQIAANYRSQRIAELEGQLDALERQ